ncbi:MAG: DUF6506 family protein [Deinococcota bacterium]
MAELTKYGFIIKARGYNHKKDIKELSSDYFCSSIVGVATLDEACLAAQKMVSDGIEVLELCGGFSSEDHKQIVQSIKGKIPVGLVGFTAEENIKLKIFVDS